MGTLNSPEASVGVADAPQKAGRPLFLITIDTEGDNLWSGPEKLTTRNAEFLPRFQTLCEAYGLKPTYLTNYEMAKSEAFVEFGREVIRRDTGEIGMHLHAWDMPSSHQLTDDDRAHHPYLIEYPRPAIEQMVTLMTDLLEETFGVKMLSHRAGRWSFDEVYAQVLIEHGYGVDCSVTPHVSWARHIGAPGGNGGTDYREFPECAYFMDLHDISRPGDSGLLEVPMTIRPRTNRAVKRLCRGLAETALLERVCNRLWPRVTWLRPNGENRKAMLKILPWAIREGRDYVEFMLHSSELMPGGSPTFQSDEDIEALYADMEPLFAAACEKFQGATLAEYAAAHQTAGR